MKPNDQSQKRAANDAPATDYFTKCGEGKSGFVEGSCGKFLPRSNWMRRDGMDSRGGAFGNAPLCCDCCDWKRPKNTSRKSVPMVARKAAAISQTPLQKLAETAAAHIRKPMTMAEIVAEIDGAEYNAELMLQHLILWAAETVQTTSVPAVDLPQLEDYRRKSVLMKSNDTDHQQICRDIPAQEQK